MLSGVSFKFKDKRIDKFLTDNNYSNYQIYYSPIKSWVFGLSFILLTTLPFSIFFYFDILRLLTTNIFLCIALVSFLSIGYLINSYYNNSFVVLEHQLLVINRNFPFFRFKTYDFKDLKEIEINKGKSIFMNLISWFFMIFGSNYVRIKTHKNVNKKFYCINLDVDCYDENWTEKSLDDFYNNLKNRNVRVDIKI